MDIKEILSKCDHTLLSVTATESEIKAVLDDGIKYGVASVCLAPCHVEFSKNYVGDRLKICTVIGFPNGYATTACKVFETLDAIKKGADEIDMVINIGKLKSGDYDYVLDEIKNLKGACGNRVLKVIVETCLLTEEEKIKACQIVTDAKADFIKTSTGFSTYGATFEDVMLFKKHVGKGVKIKAAGGIQTLADAEKFVALGADRLGTSKVVKAVKERDYDGSSDPTY
ncbi:MAG: deoxyribose-phosphate aldolase [Clostridia bacterium]|nr:deoxyribose-phosphate aldolase [Clostridia bacterium]